MSYVARSIKVAESETSRVLIRAVAGLMEGALTTMSRFQYLAHICEIATEIADAKRIPADEIFKTLAALPRDKVQEHVRELIRTNF